MSLFRTIPSAGDFSPLFRLLDDYDVHRSTRSQSPSVRSFAPRFDVRESADGYHLDGELPGVAQENINIEFTDHQTLVIKGRTERESHTESPAEIPSEEHQPTVEDANESGEVVKTGDKTVSKAGKTKSTHRYWVSERSVGEFHRTFTFPTRVDQENVKASLKNGILSVVVPKAQAPAFKKVTIE